MVEVSRANENFLDGRLYQMDFRQKSCRAPDALQSLFRGYFANNLTIYPPLVLVHTFLLRIHTYALTNIT